MKSISNGLLISLTALVVVSGVTDVAYGQAGSSIPIAQPYYGAVDACAGRGTPGSSSYGACQLQQRTLNRSADRAPDLGAINRTDRMGIEQACASDAPRGDAVYTACVRRQLVIRGSDPVVPLRRIPETQRKPDTFVHLPEPPGE